MAYQYTPKPQAWLSDAAKFEYFRNAEAGIDLGPLIPKPSQHPKCGTDAGHAAHYTAGTTPCRPCKDAHNEYYRGWYHRKAKMRTTCGTYAGYRRHMRAEGNACEWCLKAYAQYMSEYRALKKVAA